MSIDEVCREENITLPVADLYEEIHIARLTGWSLEYIEQLGLLRRQAILQIDEAETAIRSAKRKK